jgi:hypothetical protein
MARRPRGPAFSAAPAAITAQPRLPGEDYEQLMSEPLEAARRRLNITPATAYDAIPVAERA